MLLGHLEQKHILITGASKGLGRTFALEFARRGATVGLTYAHDDGGAQATLDELRTISPLPHLACKASVASLSEMTDVYTHCVREWGHIDGLVNNAGVSQFFPLPLMDEADWEATYQVNLKGAFLSVKALLPHFIKRRSGVILNIGSLAGVRILAAPVDYCATKAGMKGLTESLAKELGRYGVRVNCLAPGILEGGVARGIPEGKMRDFLEQLCIQREGTFAEVAECAAFLMSDDNAYMSGHTLVIDGGLG